MLYSMSSFMGLQRILCLCVVIAAAESADKRVSLVRTENPFFDRQLDHHCVALEREYKNPNGIKRGPVDRWGLWWQTYWEPTWSCPLEERVQSYPGDGGKWVCDVPNLPRKDCLVYSFGSNGDYSFEHGINGRRECEIHTFDPFELQTREQKLMRGKLPQKKEPTTSHPWGLSNRDYTTEYLPKFKQSATMKTLPTIVKELGHSGRVIDILKVDIDGSEVGIFDSEDMWKSFEDNGIHFNQLLIELHFQGIGTDTYAFRDKNGKKVPFVSGGVIDDMLRMITKKGYVMFHKEVNLIGVPPMDACEFSFVWVGEDCPGVQY